MGKAKDKPAEVYAPKIPESTIVANIITWCFRQGLFAWRNNTGAYTTEHGSHIRYGFKGSSDVLAIQPRTGRIICLEAKSATGKQTEEQKRFQERVETCGGIYLVIRGTDDLEENKSLILFGKQQEDKPYSMEEA